MRRLRWKVLVSIIILLLIILIACGGYLFYLLDTNTDIQITFKDGETPIIEYGAKDYDSAALIESMEGEIETYPVVNTKKIGKQELIFKVTKDHRIKKFPYMVEVKDTQKPAIILNEKTVTITINETFDPKANVKGVEDPVDGSLSFKDSLSIKKTKKNYYTIESKVDMKTVGEYTVRIKAVDKNGNTAEQTYRVSVVDNVKEILPQTTNMPQEVVGNTIKESLDIPKYVQGILLVNKTYGLPRNYIGNGPNGADATAYAAFINLQTAAMNTGYLIPLISGYRSYDYQATLYSGYVARDGQAAADRYSARPGFSEHQSGLSFDIGAIDNNYGNTVEGLWLAEHAHEYGFIIRYPAGKENITGYMYEPWHVRYVGVEVATTIWQSYSTLEEYLGV